MKILLIAGHGAGDPGAIGNGCKEADLTREVVSLLSDKLKSICNVTIADTSRNWYEYLGKNNYDFSGYDYVLEIHFNAGGGNGTEIYVTTSEKGIGVESAIVQQISAAVGYRNRGVKRYNWRVISRAKTQGVSSALLEVCFIDSAADVKTYQSSKNEIANAIVKGIAEGFGLKQSAPEHWAARYHKKLEDIGYITDKAWGNYETAVPVAHALALLDKISGGRWDSDEANAAIHWVQPTIISLCGKGWITDKKQYIDLVTAEAALSNALCLALFDRATGGMRSVYEGRNADHWARNCLDSLCDKAIVTTPTAWTDFEGKVTYGRFMALVCSAFKI